MARGRLMATDGHYRAAVLSSFPGSTFPMSFGYDLGISFCLPAQTTDEDQHGLLLVLSEVEKAVSSGLMRGTGSHFANYRKQQRSVTIYLYRESHLTQQTSTLCQPRPVWGKNRVPNQEERQQVRYLDPVRTRKPPLGQGLHQFPVERGQSRDGLHVDVRIL